MDPTSLIWAEWKRITRFLESSKIAFVREEMLWSSLEVRDPRALSISTKQGPSTYTIDVDEHLASLRDGTVLFSVVLTATYALAESYGRVKLGLPDDKDLSGGVESWGQKLLHQTGHDWSDVLDGKAGIVEVSAVRNALAHGVRSVNQVMVNRFANHSLQPPWSLGDKIGLTYERLETYRSRLKSLMRFANKRKRQRR